MDLPRKRLTARSVWYRHGHFVWDQVALGLFGLLCFRRGNLASPSRLRAEQKAKRSITEYEGDHHEAILAVIRHVGIAPWRIAIPAVLRFTRISDWTGGDAARLFRFGCVGIELTENTSQPVLLRIVAYDWQICIHFRKLDGRLRVLPTHAHGAASASVVE